MAPVLKPASNSSIDFSDLSHLQCKTEDEIESSFAMETLSQGDDDEDEDDVEDSFALKRTTKKTGDQPVSKRTLQNRKAQREFRKRREARVRELEERCRRFDQMGLEANSELQRAARGLKEENDALRGFVMRMGFGHMIPNILQDISNYRSMGNDQLNQSQQQATFSGGMFDNGQMTNQPTFFIDPSTAGNQSFNNNRARSMTTGNDFRPSLNNQIDAEKMASGITLPSPLQYGQMTLAPTPTPLNLPSDPSSQQNNRTQRQSSSKAGSSSSPSSSRSTDNNQEAPLLSLSLNQKQDSQQAQSQSQAEFAQPHLSQTQNKPWDSANTSQGIGSLFSGSNNGMGSGGTAMLQNINGGANFTPFPVVSQRNRPNAALLNPNPIPFAFNLSTGDLANQQPTWWEQMGGGSELIELDDKAQAVANAQAGAQQAPSPFDLSAFLQGGITPGGGFQLAQVGSSQGGSQSNPLAMSNEMVKTGSTDTDHMRMFIQLMERKMAERDAHTYASLGFQPPSQDPAQRNKQNQQEPKTKRSSKIQNANFGSHMTPSGVYSRLAQHPAFLSTNAREMQELVDALGPSTWKDHDNTKQGREEGEDGKGEQDKNDQSQDGMKNNKRTHSQSSVKSPSLSSSNGSPGKVHVDEIAIGKMLGLLDQKRNSNFKGFGNINDDNQRFAMAMT